MNSSSHSYSSSDLYKIWSQVPKDYYQNGVKKNLLQKIWHKNKIKFAHNLLKNLRFNNCLDLGCASGYMLAEIAKKYPHVIFDGVDAYDQAIFYAKKSYPKIRFTQADALNLPFKNNLFDLIISYETIEHVKNTSLFLKEARRVLKHSGTFILAMDSGNFSFRVIWFIWEKTMGKVWRNAHLNPVHHSHLEELIKQSKFKIKAKMFTHLGMEVVFVLNK